MLSGNSNFFLPVITAAKINLTKIFPAPKLADRAQSYISLIEALSLEADW